MLTKVVLPAPLAPMMPTVSPAAISTVTLSGRDNRAEALVQAPGGDQRRAHAARRAAPPREQRPEPGRQEQDHGEHRDADHHLPGVGRILEGEAADRLEHRHAEQGRRDMAGAGQDRDEHELARCRPIGEIRIDVAGSQRDQCAAEAGGSRPDHVGEVQHAVTDVPRYSTRISFVRIASPITPAGERRSGAAPWPSRSP